MYTTSLLVSSFENENADHKNLKQRAMDYFHSNEIAAGMKIFSDLRARATEWLRTAFSHAKNEHFHPIVGMFGGILEPSTQLDLHFQSHAEWLRHAPSVKHQLIEFGRVFKQSNVHLINLKSVRRPSIQYGIPMPDQPDVSYQKQLYVALNKLGNNTFQNYLLFETVANQVGIENITLDLFGSQIFLYTIGKANYEQFDEQCAAFVAELNSRKLILKEDRKRVVTLVNYGVKDYGATHSYDEAEALLFASELASK